MKKEIVKNFLVKSALPLGAAISAIAAVPTETASMVESLDDFNKAGLTFLISAEILGTSLLGLRFADGARNQIEKYGWQVAIPAANGIGMALLLGNMWL